MALLYTSNSSQKEGRLSLTIHSLQNKQLKLKKYTAKVYKVLRTILRRRANGILLKRGSRDKNRLLLEAEEVELIR